MNLLKQEKGLTLIEMLVAIAIFVILSILVLVNFRGDNSARALADSTLLFSQNLRKMQNYALTCKEISGSSYSSYGVYVLDSGTILLYANKNIDLSYNAGADLILERISFRPKTAINNITNSIAFKCPGSEICLNNVCNQNGQKSYIFSYLTGGSKTVFLDLATGKIETQ